MSNSGSTFASKKKLDDRPKGDKYMTPKSLIWTAKDIIDSEFPAGVEILEPCCGDSAISEELEDRYKLIENDLYGVFGKDYLTDKFFLNFNYVITNPPFSLWDEFINRAKDHCLKFMFIGRLNYFGTNSRYQGDIWKYLKSVSIFNRYVDYQTGYRKDGNFHLGSQSTAWFLWDVEYRGKPEINILDVQKYATLGAYKKPCKICDWNGWHRISPELKVKCTAPGCVKGFTYGKL